MPVHKENDARLFGFKSKRIAVWAVAVAALVFLEVLGCQKKYTAAPLAPPILTPIPTITFTPPALPNPNCAEVPIVDLTGYVNRAPYYGNILSSTDRFSDTTAGSAGIGSPDDLFVFTVFQTAYYNISLCGSADMWDSVMYLRTQCDDQATDVAYNDDACGVLSQLEVTLTPGVYYLIVDGLSKPDPTGAYQLTITSGPTPVP